MDGWMETKVIMHRIRHGKTVENYRATYFNWQMGVQGRCCSFILSEEAVRGLNGH